MHAAVPLGLLGGNRWDLKPVQNHHDSNDYDIDIQPDTRNGSIAGDNEGNNSERSEDNVECDEQRLVLKL